LNVRVSELEANLALSETKLATKQNVT
jgi:hypothetical protein